MIFNTTNHPNGVQRRAHYYFPMDPKYVYAYGADQALKNEVTPHHKARTPDDYGLDDLMHQRGEILRSKIGMLAAEIYQRHRLKEYNLYRIDLDQCTCRNLINLLGGDRGQLDFERKIIDLEQEKRKEVTSYFRDILFLKKELRESLIEKLEEEQKTSMLTNEAGGWT